MEAYLIADASVQLYNQASTVSKRGRVYIPVLHDWWLYQFSLNHRHAWSLVVNQWEFILQRIS